jgi:hypothetical protein
MPAAQFPLRWDTSELASTAARLFALQGKDLAAGLNKKMGWLLRRWLWNTPKADYRELARTLGLQMRLGQSGEKTTKTGKRIKFKGGWKIKGAAKQGNVRSSRIADAGGMFPLIFALVNKPGKSPFKGKSRRAGARAMKKAVDKKWKARVRSISYLKSAIASAQKPFLPFSSGNSPSGPTQDNSSSLKPVGKPKGFGTPAQPGDRVQAVAVDASFTKRQGDKALRKYAIPAFQRAYRDELADTEAYLEKVLQDTARKVGVRTRR